MKPEETGSAVHGAPEARGEMALHATRCAICQTEGDADELYPANFDPEALNPRIFSARRLPDRVHYRLARCRSCGLVRSDPVADPALLAELYARSTFDYGAEMAHLKRTYGHYLGRTQRLAGQCESLLEIGCGNGFFLEEALARGMKDVVGVEPSSAAVAAAPPHLRPRLVCDMMRPGLFPAERFDVVCLFQVFDHLPAPAELLEECYRILKPGGHILALNHNIAAWSARLLGRRSPIIDIEHTYLYEPKTMARIFTKTGFKIVESGRVWNSYSSHYLTRLVPLPGFLKTPLLWLLNATGLGRVSAWVPLGNLYQVARKPKREAVTAAA